MEDEIVRVCADCHSEIVEVYSGDEGWSVCNGCQNVEQEIEEWSLERFESEGNM